MRLLRTGGVSLGAVVALLIAFLLLARTSSYWIGQSEAVLYTLVAVLGLTVTTGNTGLVSLGQGAFFTVGAYTSGLLAAQAHVELFVAAVPALLLTFLAGYLFAVPALRLSGPYLGLVTLALAVITPPLVLHFGSLTHGFQGFATPSAPSSAAIRPEQTTLLVLLVVAAAATLIVARLCRGPAGRAMRQVRDNELVAATLGVDVVQVKRLAFATGSGLAGLAGALYVDAVGYLSSDSITVTYGVTLLAAATVGGLRSPLGAVLGALFAVWVPTESSHVSTSLGPVIFAAALILVVFTLPGGVAGLIERAWRLVRRRPRPGIALQAARPTRPVRTGTSAHRSRR